MWLRDGGLQDCTRPRRQQVSRSGKPKPAPKTDYYKAKGRTAEAPVLEIRSLVRNKGKGKLKGKDKKNKPSAKTGEVDLDDVRTTCQSKKMLMARLLRVKKTLDACLIGLQKKAWITSSFPVILQPTEYLAVFAKISTVTLPLDIELAYVERILSCFKWWMFKTCFLRMCRSMLLWEMILVRSECVDPGDTWDQTSLGERRRIIDVALLCKSHVPSSGPCSMCNPRNRMASTSPGSLSKNPGCCPSTRPTLG